MEEIISGPEHGTVEIIQCKQQNKNKQTNEQKQTPRDLGDYNRRSNAKGHTRMYSGSLGIPNRISLSYLTVIYSFVPQVGPVRG